MWLSLAILSALCFGVSGFLLKIVVHRKGSSSLFFLALYLIGTLVFLIKYKFIASAMATGLSITDGLSLLGIIIIAAGSSLGNLAVAKAYAKGPASLTAPLVNTNIILVVLMSILFFHERLSAYDVLGIVLLLTAVSLLMIRRKQTIHHLNRQWWLWIVLAIVLIFGREGGIKIMTYYHAPITLILMCAYAVSTFYFLIRFFVQRSAPHQSAADFSVGALAGVFSAGGLLALSQAMMLGPASIIVPIFSARSAVVVLLSVLVYRERLMKQQWLAIMLLIISVMVLGIR